MTRYMLDQVLAAHNADVILIEGPGDILAKITAADPDIVLLDLMLGEWGDGLALATAMRAHPLLLQVPVVLMSAAHHLLSQKEAAIAALGCRVLKKPFDLAALLALVEPSLV
jgi:DNA-binding response OmpR family regulator